MKYTASKRILSTLLVLLMLTVCLPMEVLAMEQSAEEPAVPKATVSQNLLTADSLVDWSSSTETVSKVVDGNTTKMDCWTTTDMKGADWQPGGEQTPQYLVVDLGEGTHDVDSVKVWYQNNKVWATDYEIQTAASYDKNNKEATTWNTVATVSRDPADATLTQGGGQNIAHESQWHDEITADTTPALTNTTLERYVRFYFKKTNDLAPGKNLNILEIEIFGQVEADEEAPAAPTGLTAKPTSDGAVLTWTAATDNVGVTGYDVYVGDETDPRGNTAANTFTLTGLASETEYTAKVVALDGAGNRSTAASISFTTAAAPQVTWDVEFLDDFENGIDSHWTKKYATAETSTNQNHTQGGGNSFFAGAEQTALVWSNDEVLNGVITVWYYDTMKTTSGVTLHVAFVESSDAPGKMAGIGINSRQNANQYMMRYPGAGNYKATGVARSEGWHEFKWDCSDGKSMKMYIDGKLINTATDITSFDKLTFGDDWTNPAGVAPGYYDDISIQGNIYVPPVDADSELDKIASLPEVGPSDTQISLPEVADGFTLKVVGSELEQVVANDGTILGTNIGQREVALLLEMSSDTDPEDTARKNINVTIPDHSGSAAYAGTDWFETRGSNAKPGIVPSVQEWFGYDGSFTLTTSSKIVLNDTANVGLDKVADSMVEDVKEISGITLTVETGTTAGPNDIYIESQTQDVYQTGKEGYVLVTDESGLKIYSSTYTGALYGTISAEQMLWLAEDHVSIPMGVIRDFPAYEVRGLFLDVARTPYRLDLLEDYSKILLWYKMNEFHVHLADNRSVKDGSANSHPEDYEGFHRLESKEFPSLGAEIRKSSLGPDLTAYNYYEDVYEVPFYTQEEWIQFQKDSKDLGVQIISELDMPGHSLVYIRYAQENPDGIEWLGEKGNGVDISNPTEKELLNLTDPDKAPIAKRFAQTLWDEYTRGDDPVFQGDVVHIGCDEYWDHNRPGTKEGFIDFMETMRQTVMDNGKEKVRVWASFNRMQLTDEEVEALGPENYQIDMWSSGNDDPIKRAAQGFQIINDEDAFMYGNPARERRDVVNAEYIYNSWDPTVFTKGNLLKGEPNLLGGTTCLWGDESSEGIIELDLHQRIMRAIPVTSEKCWGSDTDDTFQEFELHSNDLAEGPGTGIAMDVDTKSSLVVDYDFNNVSADGKTVYDASGNGYHAALTGGSVQDGTLTFDGNTLMETGLGSVGYPFTVSFDVTLTQADIDASAAAYGDDDATNDANLLSGYDGRLQLVGYNGNVSADINYYIRDLGYKLPADQEVNITLVGIMHGMKLYVDGQLVTFLSIKSEGASYPPKYMNSIYSSFVLPLEQIGENFYGSLSGLKVYNKALSAEEVAAEAGLLEGDNLVNVAQDASSTSYQKPAQDQAINRIYYAAKAVDGDGFDYVNKTVSGDTNKNSEIHSTWYGFAADSYLLVDLGQERLIDQTLIQWKGSNYAREYQIETSMDGETWDVVYTGSASDRDENGVSHGSFAPVSARYVKFQGVAFNGSRYDIQEFLVCQTVDKTALNDLLAKAEEIVTEKGLDFTSTGLEGDLFQAVVYARALNNSPLATIEEVTAAVAALEDAMQALENATTPSTSYAITVEDSDNGTVTPSRTRAPKGLTVTLTVKPDEGYKLDTLTVTDKNGNELKLTDKGNGKYTFTMPASAVTVEASFTKDDTPVDTGLPFTDVKTDDWFFEAVKYVYDNKLMDGTSTTTFAPLMTTNRAMIVTILWRLEGQPETDATLSFTDVESGVWYTDAVNWATSKGIVKGYSDTVFAPNDTVTREQLATILYRYAEYKEYDVSAKGDLTTFTDGSAVSTWAADGMTWAVGAELITGKDGGKLDPTGTATRAEVATILMRFLTA